MIDGMQSEASALYSQFARDEVLVSGVLGAFWPPHDSRGMMMTMMVMMKTIIMKMMMIRNDDT